MYYIDKSGLDEQQPPALGLLCVATAATEVRCVSTLQCSREVADRKAREKRIYESHNIFTILRIVNSTSLPS